MLRVIGVTLFEFEFGDGSASDDDDDDERVGFGFGTPSAVLDRGDDDDRPRWRQMYDTE